MPVLTQVTTEVTMKAIRADISTAKTSGAALAGNCRISVNFAEHQIFKQCLLHMQPVFGFIPNH